MKTVLKIFILLVSIITSSFSLSISPSANNQQPTTINLTSYQAVIVSFDVTSGATVTPKVSGNQLMDSKVSSDGTIDFTFTVDHIKQYDGSSVDVDFVAELDGYSPVSQTITFNIDVRKVTLQTNTSYLQFDGTSSSFLSIPAINHNNAFTIDFWVKRYADSCTETTILKNSSLRLYYFPDNSGQSEKCNVKVSVNDTDILTEYEVAADLTQDTWKNIAITFLPGVDGGSRLFLYEDGSYISETNHTLINDSTVINTLLNSNFTLGESAQIAVDELRFFNHAIDEFKRNQIINRQVLDSEISNMLRYYNFEDGYGSSVDDLTSSNLDATINGNSKRINFESYTVNFQDLANPIKVSNETNIPSQLYTFNENQLSIGAWINLDEHTTAEQSSFQIFGDSTNYSFYMEQLTNDVNGNNYRLAFLVNTSDGTQTHTHDVDLTYKKWYYLSATYDNGKFTFYIDGVNVSEFTSTIVSTLGVLNQISNDSSYNRWYYIGSEFNYHNVGFKDKLSQVSLWKKALSSQELDKIMHNYINFDDSNLIGYWSLNEENDGANLSKEGSILDFSTVGQTIDNVSFWSSSQTPLITGEKLYVNETQSRYARILKTSTIEEDLTYSENTTDTTINNEFLKYHADNSGASTVTISGSGGEVSYSTDIAIENNEFEKKLILNLKNFDSSNKTITQIAFIDTNIGEVSNLLSSNLTNGDTTLNIAPIDFSNEFAYRIRFTEDGLKTFYYNFTNEVIHGALSGSSNEYEIKLPSNQNILNLDLSSTNWIEVPTLANASISISENSTSINFNLNSVSNLVSSNGNSTISSWTITEDSDSMFQVLSDGTLSLQAGKTFDYETAAAYSFKVRATNEIGNSNIVTISVAITDVADISPSVSNTLSISSNENTNLNYDVTSNQSYSISNGDSTITNWVIENDSNNMFDISQVGVITLKSGKTLDYETATSHTFNIKAQNSAGDSNSTAVTLTVVDVIESASFTIDEPTNQNINENTTYTTSNQTIDGSYIGVLTYSISGNDASSFSVNSSTGIITMSAKDFENPIDTNKDGIYEVTLTATDSDGNNATKDFLVTINDVIEVSSFTIGTSTTSVNANENSSYTTPSPTITSDDQPIGTLTYSLGGIDADQFSINSSTGVISLSAKDFENPLDYDQDNVYEVSAIATDSDNNSSTINFLVTINDVIEEAEFTIAINADSLVVDENSSFTSNAPYISNNIQAIGTLTYSITDGSEKNLFTINSSTGVLSMAAKDFENPLDNNANNYYRVFITATDSDGNSDTLLVRVNVQDVIEVSAFTISASSTSVSANENSSYTTPTPTITSDAQPIGSLTYTLSGNDASHFTINSSTGVITMASKDFESPIDYDQNNIYEVTLTATDSDGNSSSLDFLVTINDVVESSAFTIGTTATSVSVSENNAYSSPTPTITSDAQPIGSLTYTLSGNDASHFTINNSTGVITMASKDFESPIDYDQNSIYEVTLTATDSDGNSSSINFLITVNDLIETAEFTLDEITLTSIDENSSYSSGQVVVLGDTPIGSLTYSLSGLDADKFTVSSNGSISMVPRDFENPVDNNTDNKYEVTLTLTDSDDNSANTTLLLTVNDIEETSHFTLSNMQNVVHNENESFTSDKPTIGSDEQPVGTVIFTLTGSDKDLFSIDSSTGIVTMTQKDYESPSDSNQDNTYNLAITATDDDNNSSTIDFNITIVDVIEVSEFTLSNINNTSIDENTNYSSLAPTTQGDQPIGNLTYSLNGDDASKFSINVLTGAIYLDAKDYENSEDKNSDNIYSVTLTATDADNNSASLDISIEILNVAEDKPSFDSTTISIVENIQSTDSIGKLNNFDMGDTKISMFIITEDYSDKFYINMIDGEAKIFITEGATFDYESINTYPLKVEARNDAGSSEKIDLVINVTDIADIKAIVQDKEITISETTKANSTLNESIIISNLDSLDTNISEITLSGAGSDNFIVENDGTIKTSSTANLSYDTKSNYDLTVRTKNGAGTTVSSLKVNLNANNIPTIKTLYDRYIILNSKTNSINLELNDLDKNDLSISMESSSSDIIEVTSNKSTINSDYSDTSLNIESKGQLGSALVTVTISDGRASIEEKFSVIVEEDNRFKSNTRIIEKSDYDDANTITLNIGDKFYTLENNRGLNLNSNTRKTNYSNYKIVDENRVLTTRYEDTNSVVQILSEDIRYYTQTQNEIEIYSDENKTVLETVLKIKTLENQAIQTLLSSMSTNYTINSTHSAYELLKKESNSSLDIFEEITYNDKQYTALNDFMGDFISTNKLGLLRSYDRSKLLVINSEDLGKTSGSLIEINLNTNEINNQFTGSWQIIQVNGKDVLYLGKLDGYEDNIAFTLNDNGNIARARYTNSEFYTSELLFAKDLKKDVYASLSSNPVVKLELSDTWNYISLPSSLVLCDTSIQTSLRTICNQEESLNSIFGSEDIVYMLKHDGTNWTYWDRDSDVKVEYGYNKFSAASQKDGLLIKLSAPTTITLPFKEEENNEDSFMRLYESGWYLTSISNNKTVQEIETIIETKYPDKKLSTILLLRNNEWQVYSPDENDYIDDSLTRINSKIKNSESFWISIENK